MLPQKNLETWINSLFIYTYICKVFTHQCSLCSKEVFSHCLWQPNNDYKQTNSQTNKNVGIPIREYNLKKGISQQSNGICRNVAKYFCDVQWISQTAVTLVDIRAINMPQILCILVRNGSD